MGSQRVGHDLATKQQQIHMHPYCVCECVCVCVYPSDLYFLFLCENPFLQCCGLNEPVHLCLPRGKHVVSLMTL